MSYKVIVKKFTDLEDKGRVYLKDEEYPANGAPEPTKKRIAQLSSKANKAHVQIIKEVAEEAPKVDLTEYKKADLQKMLDEKGIEYTTNDTKVELIKKLEE